MHYDNINVNYKCYDQLFMSFDSLHVFIMNIAFCKTIALSTYDFSVIMFYDIDLIIEKNVKIKLFRRASHTHTHIYICYCLLYFSKTI